MAEGMSVVGVMAEPPVASGVRIAKPVGDKIQQEIKSAVHRELIKRLDLEKLGLIQETKAASQELFAVIQQLISEHDTPLSSVERFRLAQQVLDEVFGLGPLEPLLEDSTISDILVNGSSQVFVERKGVLEKTNVVFK